MTKKLKYSELFKLLRKDGWVTVDQSGSHVKMQHPVKESVLIVPNHGAKEVKTGLCKAILKQAGIKK